MTAGSKESTRPYTTRNGAWVPAFAGTNGERDALLLLRLAGRPFAPLVPAQAGTRSEKSNSMLLRRLRSGAGLRGGCGLLRLGLALHELHRPDRALVEQQQRDRERHLG